MCQSVTGGVAQCCSHRDTRHSSDPRSPSGHCIPREDGSGPYFAGVSESIALYLQFAAQDDCEMCVGVYFITHTPGYEECVSSLTPVVLNWWDETEKLVSGLFCFRGKTTVNNENYQLN